MLTISSVLAVLSPISHARILYVEEEEYPLIEQNFTTIDLRPYTNRAFADDVAGDGKGGWGDEGPENDLRDFTLYGEQVFRGITFDIINPDKNNGTSCIVLRGQNDVNLPTSVEIPINHKAGGIYFIHNGSWLSPRTGQYTIVYSDGTQEVVEIVGRENIADWWGVTENSFIRTAWKGTAPKAGTISLGIFALENPHPDKEISKLKLESYGDSTYIHVVAITLTDTTPYFPRIKENEMYNPDTSDWYPYEYPKNFEETEGTAMDASFLLEAPAGKHGFVKAEGEDLVFEDGTKIKFWGANIGSTQLYPSHENAEYLAMILAQRGINLVRMHMHDSPDSIHSLFGWMDSVSTTSQIDKGQLDKFHYLLYCFKKRGMYVFFDTCASRQPMANDSIEDVGKLNYGLKNAVFYDDHLQELQKEMTELIMGSYNPYTQLRLCEDPVFAFVNFNNESSIFNDKFSSDYYRSIITEKYNAWLKERYPTRAELEKAWEGQLKENESQSDGTVRIMGDGERGSISGRRYIDNIEFLAVTNDKYIEKMTEHYRSMGGKQLISAGTVWGANVMSYIKSNEKSDVQDYHQYFLHPTIGGSGLTNGYTLPSEPDSWTTQSNNGLLSTFGRMKLKGMPFTISEWNTCEPSPYLSETDIIMAAYSAMHNWNPMQFAITGPVLTVEFRDSDEPFRMKNPFTGVDSPQCFDTLPAASIAFRAVTEASEGYYTPMQGDDFYNSANQSYTRNDKLYLIGKTGVSDRNLDNTQTGGENLVLAAERDAKINNKPYVSLTGEISMDTQNGIFRLNTPKSQSAAGFISGTEIELDDIIINSSTTHSTIILSSLSKDEDIYETDRLLFTASARARRNGMVLSSDGTKVLDVGAAPTMVEPVEGTFTLKTDADVTVYTLSSQGKRIGEIPVTKDERGVTFVLNGQQWANNFEIVKKGGSRTRNENISFNAYTDTPLFSDVAEEDREKIERAYLTGVMKSTSPDTFSPDDTVTRADFVESVVSVLNIGKLDAEKFSDVTEEMDCYNKVQTARGAGLVKGMDDGSFRPDEKISAKEANIILRRAGTGVKFNENETVTRKKAASVFYDLAVTGK